MEVNEAMLITTHALIKNPANGGIPAIDIIFNEKVIFVEFWNGCSLRFLILFTFIFLRSKTKITAITLYIKK